MPELPEVETIRRQLDGRLVGQRIDSGWAFESPKFTDARLVAPATINHVTRRGKYLVVGLDGDRELVIHLGMTGQLRVDPGDEALPNLHVRARWQLDSGDILEFRDIRRFGRIALVSSGFYERLPTLATIGPEPFDPTLDGDAFWTALRSSRRRIKTQLLSQQPIAGVGNIYADEALWIARVHPGARRITRSRATELLAALREVLAAGIANGGTTLRDYVDSDGLRGDNQNHLRCYGQAGRPCQRCGTALISRSIDARTSTFCPNCQRNR
jgi:formamidopyrimidine-DNA glycosylase